MDFWSRFAKIYDIAELTNSKAYHEMCEITTRITPFGARVLDCAAGTGELSIAAARKAESVLCTDISEEMLEVARKKAEKSAFNNINFCLANIFRLEDSDETYDVVIAGQILHLLDNPENAVRELYRVTKKGGKILLPCGMTKNLRGFSQALIKVYKAVGFKPSAEYSSKSYVKMLKGFNLGVVKFKTINGKIPICYAVIIKE